MSRRFGKTFRPALYELENRTLLTTNLQIAAALTQSTEYLQAIVVADYQTFLGRSPLSSEISYYVGQMQAGRSDESVEAGFAGSPEFFKTAGGTDATWVTAMYHSILDRAPTSSEVSYYVNSLEGGNSQYNISLGFARSPEHETQVVTADYKKDLDRAPSATELSSWLSQFAAGLSNEKIIDSLVGSSEFTTLHDQADANVINADYLAILNRAPKANELTNGVGLLEGTGPTNLPGSAVYNIKVKGTVNSTIVYTSTGVIGIAPTIATTKAPTPLNLRDVGIDLNPITTGTNGVMAFASNRALFQVITTAGDLSPLVLDTVTGNVSQGTLNVVPIAGVVNSSVNKNQFDFALTSGGTVQTYLLNQGGVSVQVTQGGALVSGSISLSGTPAAGGKALTIVLSFQGSLA